MGADGRKLLIVDDDRDIREVMGAMLETEGYEVELAEHGLDALARLDSFEPDLVLLDVRMPVMDGAEFVRRLRERTAAPPPIVLMSAYADLHATAAELGIAHVLQKPFGLDHLFEKVGALTEAPS